MENTKRAGRWVYHKLQCCGCKIEAFVRADVARKVADGYRCRKCVTRTPEWKKSISESLKRHGEGSTHAGTASELWKRWNKMRRRCSEKAEPHHKRRYFDRGIKVCQEWDVYENFREWAISNNWESGLTLDRIDNDLGYSPSNCRWATKSENSRHRTLTPLWYASVGAKHCKFDAHPSQVSSPLTASPAHSA